MNKKIYIILGILFLLLVVTFVFLFLRKNPTNSTSSTNNTSNTANLFPSSTPGKVIAKTKKESFELNDPAKIVEKVIDQKDMVIKEEPRYQILYFNYGKPSFLISIADPDIKNARIEAENDFLKTFGITKEQACGLDVSLTVPASINSNASGQDYGLSFCPNGKSFPIK